MELNQSVGQIMLESCVDARVRGCQRETVPVPDIITSIVPVCKKFLPHPVFLRGKKKYRNLPECKPSELFVSHSLTLMERIPLISLGFGSGSQLLFRLGGFNP